MLVFMLASLPCHGYEGWIGTITYQDDFSMGMSVKSDTPNVDSKCSENREVELRIQACFEGDGGSAVDANAEALIYKHEHEESYKKISAYALCCGKDLSVPMYDANTAVRKEGCSRGIGSKTDKSFKFTTLRTADVDISESSMLVKENGEYSLGVKGEIPYRKNYDPTEDYIDACTGTPSHPLAANRDWYQLGWELFTANGTGKRAGDVIKGNLPVQVRPDKPVNKLFCFLGDHGPQEDIKGSHYRSTSNVKWHFTKSDCFGVIDKIKGDVRLLPAPGPTVEGSPGTTIGNQPPKLGCVSNLKGAAVITGKKSGLGINTGNAQWRFGSNTKVILNDPCPGPERPPSVPAATFFESLSLWLIKTSRELRDPDPVIRIDNAANVRGDWDPRHKIPDWHKMATSVGEIFLADAMADENTAVENLLEGVDLEKVWAAFLIENRVSESLTIKALKGNAILKDGEEQIEIKEGQEYRRKWSTSHYPVSWERVQLVVPRTKPTPPTAPDLCGLLRAQRDQIIQARDACRQHPPAMGCEMFNTQIEQIGNEVRMRCK